MKTPLEKFKSERRQLRRAFIETNNEASSLFHEHVLSDKDISLLISTAAAFNEKCQDIEKEIRMIALDEIEKDKELGALFDEVNEVSNTNRGKISKLAFPISEFEKKR